MTDTSSGVTEQEDADVAEQPAGEPPLEAGELSAVLTEPWEAFVDLTAEHRPALFAFGRRLTGSAFDGEDLVQDALIRAFGAAAVQHGGVRDLRSYLFRTMANLWIDQQRRASAVLVSELGALAETGDARATAVDGGADQHLELHEAARRVFVELAPRERVAVVLHEGFGFRHGEIATMLATSEGAVRSALHRARRRLDGPAPSSPSPTADRRVLEAFVTAFEAGDVSAIRALLIDDVQATVFPYPVGQGVDHAIAEGWVRGSLYHHDPDHERDEVPYPSRFAIVTVDGRPAVAVDRGGDGGMLLEEVWVIETDDGAVARIRDYCFSPEVTGHVAEQLGVEARPLWYRFRE